MNDAVQSPGSSPTREAKGPYRFLFGPIVSRRLGRSLGIDLVPIKTCSYDCVYCQLGATRTRTVERREWVPTREVVREFEDWLACDGRADAVTLAGSGEPTLHADFGRVIEAVRERCAISTVLLTNGSFFHLSEVRRDAARAHSVKVTFSAPDEETWRKIHRPSSELRFDRFVEGLRAFRRAYSGDLAFEVMVVKGINDGEECLKRVASLAKNIGPNRVQINTPVRPPAESEARPLDANALARIAAMFDPPAEAIGTSRSLGSSPGTIHVDESRILALVLRHPASVREIAEALGIMESEAFARLESLSREGRVQAREHSGKTYYTVP